MYNLNSNLVFFRSVMKTKPHLLVIVKLVLSVCLKDALQYTEYMDLVQN